MSITEICRILRILAINSTKSVKLTGGEPFLRKDLHDILDACVKYEVAPTVCTNATLITPLDIKKLKSTRTRVKISLHGLNGEHNAIVGSRVENIIIACIRGLIANNISTSLHVLVMFPKLKKLENMINFALENQISKVTFIPFIPRGKGERLEVCNSYLPNALRLRKMTDNLKCEYKDIIDIRYLDFISKPYFVIENDGSLWMERDRECRDTLLRKSILS